MRSVRPSARWGPDDSTSEGHRASRRAGALVVVERWDLTVGLSPSPGRRLEPEPPGLRRTSCGLQGGFPRHGCALNVRTLN